MNIDISTVCFVGAGTMGCYNSLVAAVSGYDVVLYDVSADTLRQVPLRHSELAAQLVAHGYCSADEIPGALDRVALVHSIDDAVAEADLVSESVFERIEIKRDTHQSLDKACPNSTILTTNSSALLVSAIEDVVGRGDRFAAMHSHLGSPLVDIVGGPRTSASTISTLQRYVTSIGGVPLLLKREYPGYVLNAMLGPILATAMLLNATNVASVEEIDRAWMTLNSAASGPFGLMDLFGLNLIHDSWQYREEDGATANNRSRILTLLKPMVDAGELGVKSGKGFYLYPNARYQQPDFLATAVPSTHLSEALLATLIGNALLIAAHDVLDPPDIDTAWTTGMYLTLGPFALLRTLAAPRFRELLADEVTAGRFDADKARVATDYLAATPALLDEV